MLLGVAAVYFYYYYGEHEMGNTYGEITADAAGNLTNRFAEFQFDRLSPRFRFNAGTDFSAWQAAARAELTRLLKIDGRLAAPRTKLNPRVRWKRSTPLGTIEKIVISAEPDLDMPMYFCTPPGEGPFPVFICLQDHSTGMHNLIAVDFADETTPITVPAGQDLALQCLKNGYAALCIEQRGCGERSGREDYLPHDLYLARLSLLLGRTLLGDRVFDVDRGIDYLCSRSEIDRQRISIIGDSTSLYAAAVLDRISGAILPGNFAGFRESLIRHSNCNCEYIPGMLNFGDLAEVAGLGAPKALIFNAPTDPAEFARLKAIYQAAGAADNCLALAADADAFREFARLAAPLPAPIHAVAAEKAAGPSAPELGKITIMPYGLYAAWLEKQIAQISPHCRFDAENPAAWSAAARAELVKLLRLDGRLAAPRVELNPRSRWKRTIPLGTIEKFVVTTEPGLDMPMYLCTPPGQGPFPVFICLQGHSTGMHNSIAVSFTDEVTPIEIAGDRDFALQCLRRGYAALCIEQRGLGERSGRTDHKHNDLFSARAAWILDRTMIGDRVFDVDRGLDFLATRPEIDCRRIGLLGHSGGGTTSLYAGAVLDRFDTVIASGCFSTFVDSIVRNSHCNCNYIPDLLTWGNMAEIAGLCAPKKLVIVNGLRDTIFPVAPAAAEFDRVRDIYRLMGRENGCEFVIGDEGHRFYAAPAFAALEKISRQ